jgi:hypothetical protein
MVPDPVRTTLVDPTGRLPWTGSPHGAATGEAGIVARRVPLVAAVLVSAVTAALLTTATSSAAPAPDRAQAGPLRLSVPAYAGPGRLRARLPLGGVVSYRLGSVPAGGMRVLGDWDGDGAQTPGTFVDGQWRLRPSMVRTTGGVLVTFGQAGDRPVTGDWDGDGRTDLGVVRGTEWLLATVPPDGGDPVLWRDLSLADPRDPTGVLGSPVTGDWDGDGDDGVGVFLGGRWTLSDPVPAPDAPVAPLTVWYGTDGDQPVVGDWEGDGRDGLGVARGGTWFLREGVSRGSATSTRAVSGRQAADTPVAWRVPSGSGTTVCPTRRTATVGQRGWVVPSPVLDRDVVRGVGSTGRLVRNSLQQTERYLLGTAYAAQWRATRARPYLDLLGLRADDELHVRVPAMAALTVAVGLRTGALDPTVVRASIGKAAAHVDQLVRSIACTHEAVSPGGWGSGWQTAHWAMLTGAAAWLVWDRLTPQTRSDVAAMVVSEADTRLPLTVPYWSTPDDVRASPGDTKAEEDAWNAGLLALASAMMPSAPHATAWRAKAAELGVAAYAVKADTISTAVVNGVPLDQRVHGYNAFDDGTVVNHSIIHPDYAASVQLLWLAADFARLAGRRVPEAMFHNGGLVYSSLSSTVFTAGATSQAGGLIREPGGTVYVPDTSAIYYPEGDDWGISRRAHFVSLDAHAAVYARYLGATGWPAAQALLEHEKAQRRLWLRSGADDGRTYSVDPTVAATQDRYPGREEYAAHSLATAWLALYVGQLGLPGLDRGTLAVPAAPVRAPRAPSLTILSP